VKDLVELVQDDDRLKQERKRSKKNRDKYKGVSSEDYARNYSMLSFVHIMYLLLQHQNVIYEHFFQSQC